jgi:hypothetical protein
MVDNPIETGTGPDTETLIVKSVYDSLTREELIRLLDHRDEEIARLRIAYSNASWTIENSR